MEVQGFPNYLIHRDGRVWSNNFNKFLKASIDNHLYSKVILRNNKKSYHKKIHRLIAEHYIPNPDNLPFIDHINGVRSDNRIENLRWVSRQDNNRNLTIIRSNTGYQGITFCNNRNKYVAHYTINYKRYGKRFKTLEEAVAWRKDKVDKYYNRPQSS